MRCKTVIMPTMSPVTRHRDKQSLLENCHSRSIELLKRNLTPAGILAASPSSRAGKRGYNAIFGRDAAVCAIGMAVSGDKSLQRAAAAGLHTLAEHQASNGQIAKFVDLQRQEADFWYLGCIDSTLWWLIALAFLDRRRSPGGLRRQYARRIRLAISGFSCCSKTKPATGPTSCRARGSFFIRTRCGIS